MKILISEIDYGKDMDAACIPLCDALNALPGIETTESCEGHGSSPFSIWFKKAYKWQEGLFFLTRCVDHRYWKYGYLWRLELTVGDMFDGNYLPVHYHLHSGVIVGEDACLQAASLVTNLNHHLNHVNFIKGFDLHVDNFSFKNIELRKRYGL